MKFFNIDLHVSVIADIAYIFKALGHTVDDISLSGHHWVLNKPRGKISLGDGTFFDGGTCTQEICDKFYETYKNTLNQYDGFICCYPVEYALLYEKFNKPIIIVNCIRYEHPNTRNQVQWNKLNEYLLKKREQHQLYWVCNNKGDVNYTKYFLGIDGIHIPSLCEYTNCKYTGNQSQFVIHDRSYVPNISEDLAISMSRIKNPRTGQHTWENLFDRKGIIHVPYHNGYMSIFEQYTANVPMFFPSKQFTKELFAEGKILRDITFYKIYNLKEPDNDENPNKLTNPDNLNMWIDTCDFYDDDNMPYTVKFDSFAHLDNLLRTVDLKKISNDMKDFNVIRKEKVYSLWSSILNEIMVSKQ